MPVTPTSFNNIKVGYISETDGYIQNVSISDANVYAESNPDTEFIFIDGDEKVRFLTINEVNALTPKDLLRSDPCLTGDQPCGPPSLKFFGGGGVGASANPVVDNSGNLIAVDLVSGGFGYQTPPQVQVIDPCNNGSGAVLQTILGTDDLAGVVVQVIIKDSGQGYLPPAQTVPQYPAVLELTGVTVTNPGFNHNCGVDTIEVIPSNGTILSYNCDPFGKIKSVSVDKSGRFTELPRIRMNTETGFNATFVPDFSIIRDPQPVEPVITDVVQVFDLVGLNINGYVDGKPYYGNVYFERGIKYAGTSDKSRTDIVVYNTRLESLQRRVVAGSTVAVSQVEETEVEQDTIEAISSPSRGSYSTTPISAPSTTPATPSTTTTPSTGGGYSTPSTPAPAPAPSTPSTPAPPSSSPPSGGGGGGYGGGY